ncbi:uncharacterized protein LOC131956699 [Physella acuta]|uniref:uncharacterized protein LOC131956699 n=1 Tax=Physella acuta TaxID=109671 RepID=UPI0027DE3822|nr:uncharacterized protein LOC131956699 [Physella acuta]
MLAVVLAIVVGWGFPILTEAATIDTAINATTTGVEELKQRVTDLETMMTNLARQTMSQQLFVEERIRSDGHSGVKQLRDYTHGTSSYFDATHIGKAVSAMHDHSNYNDTLGMGETIVVMNGVEFRTRHNDYRMVQPHPTSKVFRAVVNLSPPPIPPAVLSKPTVDLQITEMIEWFRAFYQQNYTVRDYRPYFRPAMCYMEGAWTLDATIQEPFASDRHNLVADSWLDLQQQIRYTSYTGNKDLKENFSYLPTAIISINETTGKPVYAQWNYRILCKPYSGDIPTSYFRQQDDGPYQESYRQPLSRVLATRAARFRLSEYSDERFTWFTLLDKIFSEIPGADNIPDLLNEAAFGQDIYSQDSSNYTKLNTGYYHRMLKTGAAGAMGTSSVFRGFSDEMLFFAETTQPLIAPVAFKSCPNTTYCVTRYSRFTYAIPLEVVYLSPLLSWNPYNLSIYASNKIVYANGRSGSTTNATRAYNGTSPNSFYYLTPQAFYSSSTGESDPADTAGGGVGVLDKQGNIRNVSASGIPILSLPIRGIGSIRFRYPIPPVHAEGSVAWKEIEVIKNRMAQMKTTTGGSSAYQMELYPTLVSGNHYHEFTLLKSDYDAMISGNVVSATTSQANGHVHNLDLWLNPATKVVEYKACDYQDVCWDQHPKNIKIVSGP